MAQIPDPGAPPSVTPDGVADATVRVASSPEAFGGGVAQGLSQLGQGTEQAGNAAAGVVMNDAQLANRTAVDARYDQLQRTANSLSFGDGTPGSRGFFSMQGSDAMSSYQGTVSKLNQTRDSLAQGLSPEAAAQFDQASRLLVTRENATWGQHLEQQQRVYAATVADTTVEGDKQNAVLYRNDPVRFQQSLDDARTTIINTGATNGVAPEVTNQKLKDYTSGVYASATLAEAESNPTGAYKFFQDHEGDLSGPDQVLVQSRLKPALYAESAPQDAQHLLSGGAAAVGQGIAAEASRQGVDPGLAATVAQIESGTGSRLQNPNSSASGVFMLMPATWVSNGGTAANRGDIPTQIRLGVQNLKTSQAAADAAVGGAAAPWQVYVFHQQGAAGGAALLKADPNENAVTALAPAYGGNAAAATRAIVGNGGSATATVGQFLSMWQQNYQHVAATVSVPAPGSTPDPATRVPDALAAAAGVRSPLGDFDPNYTRQVQSAIRQQEAEREYAQNAADRGVRNTLLGAAMGLTPATPAVVPPAPPMPGQPVTAAVNAPPSGQPAPPPSTGPGVPAAMATATGGQPTARPTSLAQMLAISPAVKQAWASASATTQEGILNMLERNATEGPPTTPEAQTRYYRLLSESVDEPDAFLKEDLSDPNLLSLLPRSMVSSLMTRQASIDTKAVEQQARVASVVHARSVVMPDLRAAGIVVPNNTSTDAQKNTYADFDGRLQEALDQYQQQNGKPANDDQIRAMGRTLLTPGTIAGTSHLWGLIGPTQQKLFEAQTTGSTGKFVPTVPSADRAQIVSRWGVLNKGAVPTDEQIRSVYMTTRGAMAPATPSLRPRMGGGAAPGAGGGTPLRTASAAPIAGIEPNPFGGDADNGQ